MQERISSTLLMQHNLWTQFDVSGHSFGWRMTTSHIKCQLYMPHLLIQLCMTPFVFSREIEKDII